MSIEIISKNSMYHAPFLLPHSSVSSVVDLSTGGRWFDPWLDDILSKD